jgi:hypothetical protein
MKATSKFKRLTAVQQVRQIEMDRCRRQLAGKAFIYIISFN